MPRHSALRCVSGIRQDNAKPLISNGLRFIVTCLPTAALWVLFHCSTTQIYAKITTQKLGNDLTAFGNQLNQTFGNIKVAGI